MIKNKDQVKVFKVFLNLATSLSMFILFFVFLSCNNNEENVPEAVIELNAPIIQTPAPLIHLADNLDEQDKLGWCIDTQGIGFNEALHVHSCKPSGGDVQFYYNEETSQICSAEYKDFCLEMTEGPVEGMSLSLVESVPDSSEQKFIYDVESGQFRPVGNTNLCLAAGNTSSNAGIYMSRTLSLELIANTDVSLKKWVIVNPVPTD